MNWKSEAAAERFGLCGEELRRLLRMRAPIIIYQILWFIHMSLGAGVSCDLDCVDYFAFCFASVLFDPRAFVASSCHYHATLFWF